MNATKFRIGALLLFLCPILFLSCGTKSDNTPSHSEVLLRSDHFANAPSPALFSAHAPAEAAYAQEEQSSGAGLNLPQKRMVIKMATITCEVDSYDRVDTAIQKIVARADGYIVTSSIHSNESRKKAGTIILRIPSSVFEETLREIGQLSTNVLNQTVSGNDVTEEYTDVAARVENKKRVENRYREVLKSAKTVKDILQVEEAMGNVREEIDRLEGRKKYLEHQTAMSTITAHVQEPQAFVAGEEAGFWTKILRGFSEGVRGFADVLSFCITFLIAAIPAVVALALLVVLAFTLVRVLRPVISGAGKRDSKK